MREPLEGSYDEFPLSTDRGITTRDRADCMGADLVVFNMLGATRVSMGTMVEFGWADAARVPSVLIMEKEGNIHDYPMVREIAGFRVDNLEDAIAISEIVLLHKANPKRKALTLYKRASGDYGWNGYFSYPAMFGGAPKTGECGNTAAGAQLPRSPNAYDLYAPNKKKHPITKIYQHNFSIVRYSDNQKPNVYYVCSKCGLSDTYVSTLEYKTCEKF
jgi:hypothetical protein